MCSLKKRTTPRGRHSFHKIYGRMIPERKTGLDLTLCEMASAGESSEGTGVEAKTTTTKSAPLWTRG